jgi:hypothetical protein
VGLNVTPQDNSRLAVLHELRNIYGWAAGQATHNRRDPAHEPGLRRVMGFLEGRLATLDPGGKEYRRLMDDLEADREAERIRLANKRPMLTVIR